MSRLRAGLGALVLALAVPTASYADTTRTAATGRTAAIATGPPTVSATATATGTAERAAVLRARIEELRRQVAAVAVEAERSYDSLGTAVRTADGARRDLADAAAAEAAVQESRDRRARALYTGGGGVALWASVFDAQSPTDLLARYSNLAQVLDEESAAVAGASARTGSARAAVAARLTAARDQVQVEQRAAASAAAVAGLLAEQQRLLATADGRVRRALEQQRARESATALARLPVAVPGAGGRYACPVGPAHSFVATFGAPRSGGRSHQGTDVFAPYGSTAHALVDGVIDTAGEDGGLGGLRVWLRADNGDRYYYAHNSANLVVAGPRVRAGDPIAPVGTSGNAAGTPPHVHLEVHPGGGEAVDPFPLLAAVC